MLSPKPICLKVSYRLLGHRQPLVLLASGEGSMVVTSHLEQSLMNLLIDLRADGVHQYVWCRPKWYLQGVSCSSSGCCIFTPVLSPLGCCFFAQQGGASSTAKDCVQCRARASYRGAGKRESKLVAAMRLDRPPKLRPKHVAGLTSTMRSTRSGAASATRSARQPPNCEDTKL